MRGRLRQIFASAITNEATAVIRARTDAPPSVPLHQIRCPCGRPRPARPSRALDPQPSRVRGRSARRLARSISRKSFAARRPGGGSCGSDGGRRAGRVEVPRSLARGGTVGPPRVSGVVRLTSRMRPSGDKGTRSTSPPSRGLLERRTRSVTPGGPGTGITGLPGRLAGSPRIGTQNGEMH